ncbi:MAG: 4-hydroxy-3-methylbut-2-enyl diphosphate reductase [Synergistaceae bacterium]|jgi:4-hydroxy-3-methylbut-2-enyl diphosphate reductase|nr:4-hydroxy-3-methylbut-2-enyl diphosphate reductase [Synergistaceae bacterium]
MNLVVASPTGLCFGVRRAIEQLELALAEYGEVCSLGSPIHNPQEVDRLTRLGLVLVENASEVTEGSISFVRAHGVARSQLRELARRSRVMVDGTCPFVRTAQERAEELAGEGYRVVVVGDSNHPEVRGILGYIDGESLVISGADEIAEGERYGRLGILSQTTQKESSLAAVVAKLVLITGEVKVYNTICRATIERQESIQRLAPQVDGIAVIGGRNSANTRKLVEIAESLGVSTLWIEHSGELERRWLEGKRSIGVAAGGSTPDWLIKDLTEKLQTL